MKSGAFLGMGGGTSCIGTGCSNGGSLVPLAAAVLGVAVSLGKGSAGSGRVSPSFTSSLLLS
ncbi:MAG: hypothetical protein M5U16_14950 [Hyphomicrobium sp.]|nr:hypothetical protein [Hyphomicrobium sp.]